MLPRSAGACAPTTLVKAPTRVPSANASVFINCPLDEDYRPCFEAILFSVHISHYVPRCALEENDAAQLFELFQEGKFSRRPLGGG